MLAPVGQGAQLVASGVGDSKTLQVYLTEMVLVNMKYLLGTGFSFKYSCSLKWGKYSF